MSNLDDTPAFVIEGADRPGPWVVTCDHASNRVPGDVAGGDLGLPPEDMERHIAYDIGAEGVSRELARRLNAAMIRTTFSRLVIDPNRGLDDPTLLMKLYDGSVIDGNRTADVAEKDRRRARFWSPYHAALGELLDARDTPAMVAIHSFSPRLRGRSHRPWHVGVLFSHDERLTRPLIDMLAAEPDLIVGENEPYGGHLDGDSIDQHAIAKGRLNALIEVRHDLIETAADQVVWGARLAPVLERALFEAHKAEKR